jgi:hypothetical protein
VNVSRSELHPADGRERRLSGEEIVPVVERPARPHPHAELLAAPRSTNHPAHSVVGNFTAANVVVFSHLVVARRLLAIATDASTRRHRRR